MKRLFIAALALASLASCTKDEFVSQQPPTAIQFKQAFVNNSTRAAQDPSTTTATIDGFDVWTYMDESAGTVLVKEKVSKKNDGTWSYSNIQYWTPKHSYRFFALAPSATKNVDFVTMNDPYNNGLGTINFTNVNGTEDLLYASKVMSTGDEINNNKVSFDFDHLLSKVKFSFTNGFTNEFNTIVVKNIKMVAPSKATVTVNEQMDQSAANEVYNWSGHSGMVTLDFGSVNAAEKVASGDKKECDYERLTIPAGENQKYTVSFDVDLYHGDVLALSTTKTVEMSGKGLRSGHAYEITATIDQSNIDENPLQPIVFEVIKVDEWIEGAIKDYGTINATEVATLEALTKAAQDGGAYTLAADLTLAGTELNVAEGKNLYLDLGGYTLTVNSLDPIKNKGLMTLRNGKITANKAENTRRCVYNYGEMVIDGVEFVQTYNIKGAAINNEGKLTIEDATVNSVYYAVWTSGADAETIINGGKFTTENDENVRDTWAYAVLARNGAKLVINGGSFTGNHGVVAAEDGSEVILNAGTFNCTATYTVNSDWVLWADNIDNPGSESVIYYDPTKCTLTTGNHNGTIVNGVNVIATTATTTSLRESYDGNGATVYAAGNRAKNQNGILKPISSVDITNVNIDGMNGSTVTGQGYRAIYITKGGTYNISKVTVKNVTYAVNVNTIADVILNVTESELEGWTSYGTSTTASFTNVAFTTNPDSYGYFRPYGTTTLKDCTFDADFVIDFSSLTGTITFENCTKDGVEITAETITSLGFNDVNLSKIIFK